MKDKIVKLLAKKFGMSVKEVDDLVEVPPKEELGDFAIPVFVPAGKMGESSSTLSGACVIKIKEKFPEVNVVSNGGYVNVFEDRKELAERVLSKGVGRQMSGNRKKGKVVIDMSSPNIAKPFGIGHLRSTIIGNSIGRICEAVGFEVVRINYLGDWGTQFGKIIFGFKKWGDEKELKRNPVEHLYELYIKANDEEFDDASREEFRKLEEGDEENLKLWKRFRKLSIKEFDGIYDLLGIEFDVVSGESLYNGKMDGVVEELREKGLFRKSLYK